MHSPIRSTGAWANSTAMLLLWFVACGGDEPSAPPSAVVGALAVTVSGLPAATDAAITVTGPQNYTSTVTSSRTISQLAVGRYTVRADSIVASGTTYHPQNSSQSVDVTANATATVNVEYAPQPALRLGVQLVAQLLVSAVYVTAPPGDTRLFIVEQTGRIRIWRNGAMVQTPFLDISSRVTTGGERGLLSMAFDPDYQSNGRFYVYYTGAQGDIIVDRHTVSSNPDVANNAAERVIAIEHRQASNHNGGLVLFGPDGMLYLATGDGGGSGDPQNNAQNINSLLGKMLRIDVRSLPYTIPADNPFVGRDGSDEIWAVGLRNPWRFAFDTQATQGAAGALLYIADVGQNAREEVNVTSASLAGVNYGWRIMEGSRCFNPATNCNISGLRLPAIEYDHGQGCSITGGFVYRGTAIPRLRGHYFYSDFCTGFLRSFRFENNAVVDERQWNVGSLGAVLSFGLDGAGELYVLTSGNRVYRIREVAGTE